MGFSAENIGNFHMAHSFVRGNWRNSDTTSPIILQKSCHDMDILVWPATVIFQDQSGEGLLEALQSSPYGRCVFRCDNNADYTGESRKEQIQNEEGFHGGGDYGLTMDFLDEIRGLEARNRCSIERSVESHLMVFAAE